jgi:hypothetical protein
MLFFNSVLETATTNEQVRGETMRKLAVIGAMAFIALTSFSSLSAFAAQSCDGILPRLLPIVGVQELVSQQMRANLPPKAPRSLTDGRFRHGGFFAVRWH